jgi:hypothetical protein
MTSLTWEKSIALLAATSNVAFEKRKKEKSLRAESWQAY